MKSVADYKTPILMQLLLGSAFLRFHWKRAKTPGIYLPILFQEVDSMSNEQTRVSRIRHALFFSNVETYLTPRTTNASHKEARGKENCFSIKQSQKKRNSENFRSCILVSFPLFNNSTPILWLREVDLGSDTRYCTLNIRRGSFAQFFLGYTWISCGHCFT